MDKVVIVKKVVQLCSWSEMEIARQRSGLTVTQWCEQEHISHSTYYYRLRKVRENICEQIPVPVMEISEKTQTESSTIKIVSGNVSVEMTADVPAEIITAVIGALKC